MKIWFLVSGQMIFRKRRRWTFQNCQNYCHTPSGCFKRTIIETVVISAPDSNFWLWTRSCWFFTGCEDHQNQILPTLNVCKITRRGRNRAFSSPTCRSRCQVCITSVYLAPTTKLKKTSLFYEKKRPKCQKDLDLQMPTHIFCIFSNKVAQKWWVH